jgi:hypothetical protein
MWLAWMLRPQAECSIDSDFAAFDQESHFAAFDRLGVLNHLAAIDQLKPINLFVVQWAAHACA